MTVLMSRTGAEPMRFQKPFCASYTKVCTRSSEVSARAAARHSSSILSSDGPLRCTCSYTDPRSSRDWIGRPTCATL